MKLTLLSLGVFVLSMMALTGCENPPSTVSSRDALTDESQAAIKRMTANDQSLQSVIDNSNGYVIFPSVGKGGFIVGAAYGKGEVYEKGRLVGYAEIQQASVGATVGGQEFAEMIVFKDQDALRRFQEGKFGLAANASAVALKAGAAAGADFKEGTAVFVMSKGGAMVDASVGGQKFAYQPLKDVAPERHNTPAPDLSRSNNPDNAPR